MRSIPFFLEVIFVVYEDASIFDEVAIGMLEAGRDVMVALF